MPDSEAEPRRGLRGIKFDPTFNLGHVVSAGVSLFMVGMAWANLDARVTQTSHSVDKIEKTVDGKADKDAVGKGEIELSRRITEQQRLIDQTSIRTAEDIREIKIMIREGLKDLDAKIERKADKPGR